MTAAAALWRAWPPSAPTPPSSSARAWPACRAAPRWRRSSATRSSAGRAPAVPGHANLLRLVSVPAPAAGRAPGARGDPAGAGRPRPHWAPGCAWRWPAAARTATRAGARPSWRDRSPISPPPACVASCSPTRAARLRPAVAAGRPRRLPRRSWTCRRRRRRARSPNASRSATPSRPRAVAAAVEPSPRDGLRCPLGRRRLRGRRRPAVRDARPRWRGWPATATWWACRRRRRCALRAPPAPLAACSGSSPTAPRR